MKKGKGKAGTGTSASPAIVSAHAADYGRLVSDIAGLLEQARRSAARSVNAVLTATYWEVGRRIVEHEQGGKARAAYGEELLTRLSKDLTARGGRGFSRSNVAQMRTFYQAWEIVQTVSGQSRAQVKCPALSNGSAAEKIQTLSGKSGPAMPPDPAGGQKLKDRQKSQTLSAELGRPVSPTTVPPYTDGLLAGAFPLSWSHYVHLMAVTNPQARLFYEREAIRGGWSVRQLDRQIGTQFYERALHSKNPAALLARGQVAQPQDTVSVEEEVRNPYVLEFLNLKDEYGENELEEALIRHLQAFLLEMGAGFTFVARQKRIRVGDSWYRIDLLLYHRGLRCLVVIDLKTGTFTHADAGQMNLYLNYVKEHLTMPSEADPVGIILCSKKDDAVVRYATGGIRARVFASEYLTKLPDVETLRLEILKTRRALQARRTEGEGD